MNSQELRIFTCLTHLAAPESYRITDNGTKLYVIEHGMLIFLQGEGLDKMTSQGLYSWYRQALHDWYLEDEICARTAPSPTRPLIT